MAATTSTHRCVLKSLRLLYHRSCWEQSDSMLTVGITFVFMPYIPARGKTSVDRIEEGVQKHAGRLHGAVPELK